MAGKCSQPNCYPHETGCDEQGCVIVENCKYYNKKVQESHGDEFEEKELSSSEGIIESYRVPWTGETLGLSDLNFITASTKITLIGIIGASNTGKTTFLTLLYCLLRHGEKIGDYSFAGSYTLTGWENISWYLRWKNHASIQFPPHTSINAGRTPGLLHLALKNEKGEEKDLIFTDAPGEWFEHWRINSNSDAASGAKWVYENSSAFLLFADSDQLSGEKRGTAKLQINTIADRIVEKLLNRPLALIWSKSDKKIQESTKEQILSHITLNGIGNFKDFQVSIYEGENQEYHKNICKSIEWILSCKDKNINHLPPIKVFKPEDIFLSKRSING